jgi:hypothetical protein
MMQLKFVLVFFITIMCAGCSAVSVQNYKPNPSTAKLDRVLIVAMTNKYDTRTMYEEELSYRLREMGYNMFSSVNVDKNKKNLYTKEEILQLIEDKNIDGIITMRLKDVDSKDRYSYSGGYLDGAYNQPNYFFSYMDNFYSVNSWSYQTQQTIVIEANLFDAHSKTLIYQIDGPIKNADGAEERASEFSTSFAKSFDQSGLLKKK